MTGNRPYVTFSEPEVPLDHRMVEGSNTSLPGPKWPGRMKWAGRMGQTASPLEVW